MRCFYKEHYPGCAWCVKFDCGCSYDDLGQDPHDPNGQECEDYEEKKEVERE